MKAILNLILYVSVITTFLFACLATYQLFSRGRPIHSDIQGFDEEGRRVRPSIVKSMFSVCTRAFSIVRTKAVSFIGRLRSPRCTAIDFEEAIFTIASCLEANMSLIQALSFVAREAREPLRSHFTQLMREYRVGVPLSTSLERLSARLGGDEATLFTEALEVYRTHGGNILEVLEVLTESLRERRLFTEKVGALTAEARWSAVLLASLPPALMLVTLALQGDLVMASLGEPLGRLAMFSALLLWLSGTVAISKVVRV